MAKNRKKGDPEPVGPVKGEFVAPPEELGSDAAIPEGLPQQEEFWRPPVRFGSVPVEKEPLGWDRRQGFRKLFPAASGGRASRVRSSVVRAQPPFVGRQASRHASIA